MASILNKKEKWKAYQYCLWLIIPLAISLGCGGPSTLYKHQATTNPNDESEQENSGTPRLALWLAKKNELTDYDDAGYELVMSGWFEPAEADIIKSRNPSTRILAGLSPTWIFDDPEWLRFLIIIANGGNVNGPLQISEDMYLMLDDNKDGSLDRRCSPPGWDKIYAMDPRHSGWKEIILSFYKNVAEQPQHDGVIVDMVDAYPFCEGAWSIGDTDPLDTATWISAQTRLISEIREEIPANKWLIANAGHDFPVGSPFPKHLNGYLLENFLGNWGASLEEGLATAKRALDTTDTPHIVIFAVDTDDTGEINWPRFRVGFVASLLMDNTYFAFDYGSRDHGGVKDWWFPEYYKIVLGKPLAEITFTESGYRRDFQNGVVIVAKDMDALLVFNVLHKDLVSGEVGLEFIVPKGDAKILLRVDIM